MNPNAILTRREKQIAELIAWGATKKDVANQLQRSVRTVENTTRSIYEKTGVTKSNELSAWWFCVNFNISFNLSPIQKKLIALFFLSIFLPFNYNSNRDAIRAARIRAQRVRISERGEGEEKEPIILFE